MPDNTNDFTAELPTQQLKFFPSLGKILVLASIALFFGMVIAVALLRAPIPVAGRLVLGALPGLFILSRWIIHRPSVSVDVEGITLRGFDFRRRFVPWNAIKTIELAKFSSRGTDSRFLAISFIETPASGKKRSKKMRVTELLLPVPVTSVMLQLMQAFDDRITARQIRLKPAPVELQEIAATISHPWVWSRQALTNGAWIGAITGIPLGIAMGIVYRFFPAHGNPPPALDTTFFILALSQVIILPAIFGIWLTRRWRGNRAPAMVASGVASFMSLVVLSIITASGQWPGIIFVILPSQAFFLWLAAPLGDRDVNEARRARIRDALRGNDNQALHHQRRGRHQ